MDCPFCGKEMKKGIISGGFKWVEDGRDAWEGIPLTTGLLGRTPKSFYCPDCRQIVLPVPENAGFMGAVQQKIDTASEKFETVRGQWETRRNQTKEQKQKKEFGSKDPWEL